MFCLVGQNPCESVIKSMILDRISSRNRHCEESAWADDVAISYSASSYTIEIATLPPVARDDVGLMSQLSCGFDISAAHKSICQL